MSTEATVDRSNPDGPTLLLIRRLPHPVARVWEAITRPEELSQWYPCRIDLEPREGGRITFHFDDEVPEVSRVTEFDPPHALAYEWSGERLRWTVEPDGGGSILRLSNTVIDPDWMPRTAAGWDTCFEDLLALLTGEPVTGHSGADEVKIERYRTRLM
ncbi:SRPBCC family protein [Cumulibacter soli]|uniref:SRPBCC family protein n=1 Tax=Cumulibacter soli TaxID=2546344 RepID=UPI00106869F1|nr:SRPBCC family protein [Cumulibacter soli]